MTNLCFQDPAFIQELRHIDLAKSGVGCVQPGGILTATTAGGGGQLNPATGLPYHQPPYSMPPLAGECVFV